MLLLGSWRQPLEQVHEAQQIRHAKQASPGRQRHKRIGLHHARPRGRHGPQPPLLVVETDPVLSPGLVPGDQFELAATLRVEGMGDPDDWRRYVRITCS
jgi:hypothetical protein